MDEELEYEELDDKPQKLSSSVWKLSRSSASS